MTGKHTLRDDRENARPAHFQIQPPIHGQDRIAHFLGFKPSHVEPPEQIILRIFGKGCWVSRRRHLVCVRQHQHPVHGLELPTFGDEFTGEPIEQFRMRGPIAETTEIIGRANDAPPEVMLEDSIHHHAGHERVAVACQPFRQHTAAT